MTNATSGSAPARLGDEAPVLAVGSVLLRWRRAILTLGLGGAVLGLVLGLAGTRLYTSSATLIPQGSDAGLGNAGLALAASQLGIRIPTATPGWGPPVYVELLGSRELLERIAQDTVVVEEQGGRRVAVADLLEVRAPTAALRLERAVRALRRIVSARGDRNLSAVKLSVATRWPSVSLALAARLVDGVNRFNLESRRSQAAAERRFVEGQAAEAERALRDAEDRMQTFLQRNRATDDSPELQFRRDRLQREVSLRQQVYTSLMQNLEEARIREVRDTPVFTVLEAPRLAVSGESRKVVQKLVLGGLVGGFLGLLVAALMHQVGGARRSPNDDAREFFGLLEEATPRFLRRRG